MKKIVIFILSFFYIFTLLKAELVFNNNVVVVKSTGVAFLGSIVSESEAQKFALDDAKRNALEQVGTYLESRTDILNYIVVKDEIITYTGSMLKAEILNKKRVLKDNTFGIEVEAEVIVDTELLNERIKEVRNDQKLKKYLENERKRNIKYEQEIINLQSTLNKNSEEQVKRMIQIYYERNKALTFKNLAVLKKQAKQGFDFIREESIYFFRKIKDVVDKRYNK